MKLPLNAAARFFVLAVSIANLCWATESETNIAGRLVNVDLVKADDLSHAAWPDGHFELTKEAVTTQETANIYDLLTADGIEPDVEAFTVVYDLNPSLKQVDPLPTGVNLVLPKVRGGGNLQQKLKDGYLVMLTVDRTLRVEFAESASRLQDLSTRFADLPAERFADPAARSAIVSNVKALAVWFAYVQKTFLQRTGPPLRRQTLLGMHDEAAVLNSILAAIVRGQEKVTPTDQEQVNAIYTDIQVQMKKYDNIMAGEPPVADQRYEVVVTIRNADRLENPQVYYALEGLFRKPPKEPYESKPFEKAVSGLLTFGDYVIWVGKPDHPFPPLTDQKPIRIEAAGGNPRNMVLSVIQ
jgi:hypothetical protein